MIANCPTCGTRYKIERPPAGVRGRCGRCDAGVALPSLRTYRIVAPGGPSVAAAKREFWKEDEPLPAIPEMTSQGVFEATMPRAIEGDILAATTAEPDFDDGVPAEPRAAWTTFALWVAAGSIAGTGISWTMGGDTVTGVAAGAAVGAVAGWGWARWTSLR